MKNLITKMLTFGGLSLLALASCKKDGVLTTANLTSSSASTLTVSAPTATLSPSKLTDPTIVETFSFTAPSFGYAAAVVNILQLDAPGDNWAHPYSVTMSTNVLSQGYNTSDFNTILLKMGLKGGTAATINARIQSTIGVNTSVYSAVVPITVTPFNLKSWLYVAGAYEGWANPGPQEDSLYSATSNGIYIGIINFTAGNNQFLVLPAKNWNNKYATHDPTGSTSSTVTYNANNNFYAPSTAGQYLVTLNLNLNTISFQAVNYYSLIGSAPPGTAWSTDSDMKYLNDGTSTWVATVPMIVGQFKVRQNHDWTYSWGDISPADGVDATDNNGGNINITTAKTYTIGFTIPITAVGVTPSVTATYSIH